MAAIIKTEKTVTEMTITQLIDRIYDMAGKINHDEWMETIRVYDKTWNICSLTKAGLVKPLKAARSRIEDFYWVVERQYTKTRNS